MERPTLAEFATHKGAMDIPVRLTENSPFGQAGQVVRLALTPDDVHDPTENPTLIAGFKNAMMCADLASPPILVSQDHDKYRTFDEGDTFRRVDVKGSWQGAVPEVDPKTALTEYTVVDRFLGSFIPNVTTGQATGYRPRIASLRRIRNAMDLDREYDVWDMLRNTANWNANNVRTLLAAEKWNGGASSDPVGVIQAMLDKSLQQVTDLFMNQRVALSFMQNPLVKDHLRMWMGDSRLNVGDASTSYNQSGSRVVITIPGLPRINVCSAKAEALTGTTVDYVLGDDVIGISRLDSLTDEETITTSTTFRRSGIAASGFVSREFPVPNRGPYGGVMVVMAQADRAVMRSTKVGFLIKAAYQ